MCDIWRGYWAQRLLWEVGGSLVFSTASVLQIRNEHDYLLDFIDEKALYHDATRLVQFLQQWRPKGARFFDRVLELSIAMAEEGFWEAGDAWMTKAWLEDLIAIGYQQPALRRGPALGDAAAAQFTPKNLASNFLAPLPAQ